MRILKTVFWSLATGVVIAMAASAQPQPDTRVHVPYGSMLSLACQEAFGLNPKRFSSAPCWEGAKHGDGTPVANPNVIQPGEFLLPEPPYGVVGEADAPAVAVVAEAPADALSREENSRVRRKRHLRVFAIC